MRHGLALGRAGPAAVGSSHPNSQWSGVPIVCAAAIVAAHTRGGVRRCGDRRCAGCRGRRARRLRWFETPKAASLACARLAERSSILGHPFEFLERASRQTQSNFQVSTKTLFSSGAMYTHPTPARPPLRKASATRVCELLLTLSQLSRHAATVASEIVRGCGT